MAEWVQNYALLRKSITRRIVYTLCTKEKNKKKENDGINNRNLDPSKIVCKYIKSK